MTRNELRNRMLDILQEMAEARLESMMDDITDSEIRSFLLESDRADMLIDEASEGAFENIIENVLEDIDSWEIECEV